MNDAIVIDRQGNVYRYANEAAAERAATRMGRKDCLVAVQGVIPGLFAIRQEATQ